MGLKGFKKLLKGIHFLKLKKTLNYYKQNGIIRIKFNDNHKTLYFLQVTVHKVSCDSPCCTKLCGEDNHCIFNIDTHGNVNSDSDEDDDTDKNVSTYLKKICNNIFLFASVVQVVVQVARLPEYRCQALRVPMPGSQGTDARIPGYRCQDPRVPGASGKYDGMCHAIIFTQQKH